MLESQTSNWIGHELANGRYRVDAQLGEGGMGTVFRAWDKNLSTEVVIKVPHAAMLQDEEFAARFAREISSMVKLSHPHIVKISDVGNHDRLPFAVMQFLPGGSLEDRQKSGPHGESRAVLPSSLKTWLPSIAEALDFVHSQGYIHRDVKPANILFDSHGHAYLSDFGIAKSAESESSTSTSKALTGTGMVIGTPEYMAPELIMGQTCDGRVDQYALAVTVFEMLAGRRPFDDSTSTALYVQNVTNEHPDLSTLSPDVSPAIAATIHRAFSKSPEQRFASCRAFATVLLGAVETLTANLPEAVDSKCPVCQSSLKLADRMRGKQLRCAGCHSLLDVSDDLSLMPVLSSANETAARATPRLSSGTRGQAVIPAVEADNSDRLKPDHVSDNKVSEPVPAKLSTSATRRATSLDEATLRSKSGKTIRPAMLPSSKTKSSAPQHAPKAATQPWINGVWKRLHQFICDFRAFARRHPTLITAVVVGLVLASIPPLMIRIFEDAERDDNPVNAKVERDSTATTSASQSAAANKTPMPSPASAQPAIAKSQTPETVPLEKATVNSDKLISKFTGMEFVLIPAGEFMMGSSDADVRAALQDDSNLLKEVVNSELPQHLVKITQPFYMASHEVTQEQYQQVMGINPSAFSKTGSKKTNVLGKNTDRFPVESVSWFNAVEFCIKLSEADGRTPYYRLTSISRRSDQSIEKATVTVSSGNGYRLPTEAEWEYGCRANTTTPFHFGSVLNGEQANMCGKFPFGTTTEGPFVERPTTVGSYPPNAFGLFDMHGNVWEWCQDYFDEKYYAQKVESDPQGPSSGKGRAFRGGAWNYSGGANRAAYRGMYFPEGLHNLDGGFRVVCVPTASYPKQLDTPSQPADAKQPDTSPPITSKPEPRAGEEREDNGLKMKFCWCPPGTFTMGSPVTEVDRNTNEDQVVVTLSKGFWMGKFEVMQGEWQQIMGTTLTQQKTKSKKNTYGEIAGRGARHPMYFVTYDEANEFCVKLSKQERRDGRLPDGWRYRLPTEAQWEYACRAETLTATAFGDSLNSSLANFNGDFPTGSARKGPNLNRTTEVGSYKPNGWGLCDMHGNVIELCEDLYVEKLPGGHDPATVKAPGVLIIVARSGAWNGIGGLCRSAFRSAYLPGSRHASVGFRVALVPEEPQKPSSAPPPPAVAKPK